MTDDPVQAVTAQELEVQALLAANKAEREMHLSSTSRPSVDAALAQVYAILAVGRRLEEICAVLRGSIVQGPTASIDEITNDVESMLKDPEVRVALDALRPGWSDVL